MNLSLANSSTFAGQEFFQATCLASSLSQMPYAKLFICGSPSYDPNDRYTPRRAASARDLLLNSWHWHLSFRSYNRNDTRHLHSSREDLFLLPRHRPYLLNTDDPEHRNFQSGFKRICCQEVWWKVRDNGGSHRDGRQKNRRCPLQSPFVMLFHRLPPMLIKYVMAFPFNDGSMFLSFMFIHVLPFLEWVLSYYVGFVASVRMLPLVLHFLSGIPRFSDSL